MERLGVLVEDGGLVVDLGCGSGTSTRQVSINSTDTAGYWFQSELGLPLVGEGRTRSVS